MQKTLSNGQVVEAVAVVDQNGDFQAAGPGGGGGGGGAVTIANGADVALGATTATAATADGTGDYSLLAAAKRALLNWAALLARIPAAVTPGLLPVDTLAGLGTPRLIAMGASSANLALTTTCRRVSIVATVAGFYAVGTGAQTASSTTHYIGAGERLDFDVGPNTQIAAIRASADGTLYISELT